MQGSQAHPLSPALSVQNLVKSYSLGTSSIEVLRGVCLEVPAGQMCAVMGPSEVGKSTLLNCIAGLNVPDSGQIQVLGEPMVGRDDTGRTLLRRQIGIIYQFFNLVSNLTVRENVLLPFLIDGQSVDEAAVSQALERVGMSRRDQHYPSQLSGGEMQLVSIARAIVRQPKLVLADEPTGNVNVATGRKIMALLTSILKETPSALLLVTHNPEDAARADRIVFMKDGALCEEATLQGDAVSVSAVHETLRSLGI